ncbi:hypothetical protein EST38_g5365 [Candolleomyces aberdarensis]|uniref:SEP domain-containing protein n=1 Tax=Candolleomyces aberdarensis TaxID=2316362 RepID=A0A4Q2DMQ0_9AGAR|nr:hypothetical protein EST38_g5365 [Candolleomyces aberdarensis]
MSGNDDSNAPRTLGGAPVGSSDWARSSDRPRVGRIGDWNNGGDSGSSSRPGSRGIATLGGLGGGSSSRGPPRRPADDDDDDDDDDENKAGESWFAGGERRYFDTRFICFLVSWLNIIDSGISVQNPGQADRGSGGDLVQDLLRRAARGGMAPPPEEPRSRAFFGGGHTLGSDEVESTFVPDPSASEEEIVTRHITLWRQGFQIEDGELRRYDEPENAAILAQINSGNAPLALMDAREGQRVELRVAKRTHEDYEPPQGSRAFIGAGQRLGAPVPSLAPAGSNMPGEFPAASSTPGTGERESITTRFEVDQTLPTTSVQIRLADGTRYALSILANLSI